MIDWKQVCKDDISDRTILLTGNGKFAYKINKKKNDSCPTNEAILK